MAGLATSNSANRSIAPAPRCTSPQTSLKPAAEEPTNIEYIKNCASSPPLIEPASTAREPVHRMIVIAPNTRVIPNGCQKCTGADTPDCRFETLHHRLAVTFALQGLQREGLHRLDGVEGLIRQPAGIGNAVLGGT